MLSPIHEELGDRRKGQKEETSLMGHKISLPCSEQQRENVSVSCKARREGERENNLQL